MLRVKMPCLGCAAYADLQAINWATAVVQLVVRVPSECLRGLSFWAESEALDASDVKACDLITKQVI